MGAAALALLGPAALALGATESEAVRKLWWRSIGPANMGGRVADIAGLPGDPSTYYVVPANGGIFKTTNGGVTFTPIFDKEDIASVGAIAIAPSDPNVIWAGSGEGDPRNSASFGIGVFRSTDGGSSWKHLGLADSERIKRIRVDPKDPDTAYVCALGHAWGPNEERGVFKTTDGGRTWRKVLFVNKDTGCSDIDMDPGNPRVLYAGLYTFRRQPWRFDSGGGETALHKSTDGGETWKKLTKGLPKGPMDRIGVAVAPSAPEVVYMITETKDEGELFRSEDRGESWAKVSDDRNINFRPFYYSDIRVDPRDPQRVYSLSGGLFVSKDGGKTFQRIAQGVHGDHQAFWIDPQNPKRILSGSDGGFQLSYDGGKTWEIVNNFTLSQFYHLSYDLRRPYHVCGGLQDNGSWCGPSATPSTQGIRKEDWYTVGGGDGFFAVPDPSAPHLVYSDSQG
ncbi:MAG TPA: glycosyl hydrolase, partial [Vicinamibacteria bacterium]